MLKIFKTLICKCLNRHFCAHSFPSSICVCDICTHVCGSVYPCEQKDGGGGIECSALSLPAIFPCDSLFLNLELGLAASPRDPPVPHTNGVTRASGSNASIFFKWILDVWTQVLMLSAPFFLFSSRLNKLLLLRTTQKTFPASVGKWSVFNWTTLPLAPSWTQPQTTDKEVGLCATIFYLPIFGYPRLFLCCALFKLFRQSV